MTRIHQYGKRKQSLVHDQSAVEEKQQRESMTHRIIHLRTDQYLKRDLNRLIIARILINFYAVKELFFEKDKTAKKTPKKVCELSKMLKFHLN